MTPAGDSSVPTVPIGPPLPLADPPTTAGQTHGGASASASRVVPISSFTSAASSWPDDSDDLRGLLLLYDGLTSAPRKEFIRRLGAIAADIETVDDPSMHLGQVEEIMQQYLAPAPADSPASHALIGGNPEFTVYFLDSALPTIVRNLLVRSYSSMHMRIPASIRVDASVTIVPRVNDFLQTVLRVIVHHLRQPTQTIMMSTLATNTGSAQSATGHPSDRAGTLPAPVAVGPLFPDSISLNLVTTLQRIFDRERQFYYFYDRKGKGAIDDDEIDLSDDEEDQEDDDDSSLLGPSDSDAAERGVAADHTHAVRAQRLERQSQRERERAAKIEARIAARSRIEEHRPSVLYSLSLPGMPSHGWLQRNIQFFGEIGGFDLIADRLGSGIAPIDSRIPVATRGGINPAQGARQAFYRRELARRVAWAQLCATRGEEYSADPPTPPPGSFPSIAPYLTPAIFVAPTTTSLPRIPLHRARIFLDAILKVWDLMDPAYFARLGTRLKDVIIVRLLHLRPEESRLCDKEYLQTMLQDYLWKFIKNLCVAHTGDFKAVSWPRLDDESEQAWKADRAAQKQLREAAAARADEVGDEVTEESLTAPSSSAVSPPPSSDSPPPMTPPPVLYELNLNADECMECITIYLSYQLFCSPLLEKRINGLADINRMVDLTRTRQRLDDAHNTTARDHTGQRIPFTAWLNREVLGGYLMQIRILDELFGTFDVRQPVHLQATHDRSAHPHLIQRSDEILCYLAQLGRLTSTHLRQVWAASIGKHETIVHAIYTLLGVCVRGFQSEHIRLILDEFIPSIPISDWSDHTLRLVVALTTGGDDIDEETDIIERGVGILWRVMMMPHVDASGPSVAAPPSPTAVAAFPPAAISPNGSASFYMKQACAKQIHLLLRKPNMEPLRRSYILRILSLLRSHATSHGLCLWLLPCLLSAYSIRGSPGEEPLLDALVGREKLFELLLVDLAAYTQRAGAALDRVREATTRKYPRRRLPDSTLLVLDESTSRDAGKDTPIAQLGVAISDLDASVTLPAGMDASTALLSALKSVHATVGAGSTSSVTQSGASTLTMTRSNSSSAAAGTAWMPYSESLSYELELLIRLELLRFVVVHSFHVLTSRHVDQLWVGAVEQATSDHARRQMMMWLRTLHHPKPAQLPTSIAELQSAAAIAQAAAAGTARYVPNPFDTTPYCRSLSDDAVLHLFERYLSNPSPEWIAAHMDDATFACWRHYFLVINESQRRIRLHAPIVIVEHANSDAPQTIGFSVAGPASSSLLGIEYLWTLCLHAQHPNVVSSATHLLLQSHMCSTTPPVHGGEPTSRATDAESTFSLRERYIARCMEFMQAGDKADPAHSTRILRCLTLMQAFMAACEADEVEEERHAELDVTSGAADVAVTIDVQVGAFTPDAGEVVRITINDGQNVHALKEHLSSLLSVPPSKMTLYAAGRELREYEPIHAAALSGPIRLRPTSSHKEDERAMEGDGELDAEEELSTLRLARAFTPATANNTPLPHTPSTGAAFAAFPSASSATAVRRTPMQLLSNNQLYFDTLFSLLSPTSLHSAESTSSASSPPEEISHRVWRLITSLPTNHQLLDEMKSLACISRPAPSPVDANAMRPWQQLLDTRSPFKLLYSLRIIAKLASVHLPQRGAATASKMFVSAVEWRNKFIRLGGVAHLYEVVGDLMQHRGRDHSAPQPVGTATTSEWDNTSKACFALAIRLFNFFLLCSQAHSNRAVLYLLPAAIPGLDASALDAIAGQNQLISLMRGLSLHTDFMADIDFCLLTRLSLQLLADCAKSAAKQWKTNGQSHVRTGSIGNSKTGANGSSAAAHQYQSEDTTNLDEELVRHALVMLSACILHQPFAAPTDADGGPTPLRLLIDSADSTVYSTMLFLCAHDIRHAASEGLMHLALQFKSHAAVDSMSMHRFLVQDVLLRCLPTLSSSARYATVAQEYFQLLDRLMRDVIDHELDADDDAKIMPGFDWHALFLQIVVSVRSRPTYESTDETSASVHAVRSSKGTDRALPSGTSDEVLVGLMNLVSTMADKMPSLKTLTSTRQIGIAAGLAHEVFLYLFELPTVATSHLALQPPKAKHRTTRVAAFNLLLTLCNDDEDNFYSVASLLHQQNVSHNSVNMSSEWEYSPADSTKSATGYVGLQNLSSTCIFETDGRVLTDRGFLFLGDIEHILRAGEKLLYACYDRATLAFVYRTGQLVLAPPPEYIVDFTEPATRHCWDDVSDPYGDATMTDKAATRISMRVTPDHDMFVQLVTGDAAEKSAPPSKIPAEQLTPGYECACRDRSVCAHAHDIIRFISRAENGLVIDAIGGLLSPGDLEHGSPVGALKITSDAQLTAFIELYGCWVGAGSIADVAVVFSVACDPEYMESLLLSAGLTPADDWTYASCTPAGSYTYSVHRPSWLAFFDEESRCCERDRRLGPWAMKRLDQQQMRVLISGLQLTESTLRRVRPGNVRDADHDASRTLRLRTSSIALRDQLVHAGLHAGYSAYFTRDSEEKFMSWCIHFEESDVQTDMHIADVRYRSQTELRSLTRYNATRDGRVWCVSVDHPDALIVAQRAHADKSGVVTKASKPIVIGNCYLNSMMQQLYMLPDFRRKLLSIDLPHPAHSVVAVPSAGLPPPLPSDPADNLLYQVQLMFAFLAGSTKKAYNPTNFCRAFKDYDGRPIDVRVQQDVDEFFNALCDKLESTLQSTHAQAVAAGSASAHAFDVDLVKSTFGGELEHQLLCRECPHTSHRSEAFCALPLNVKNKSSIGASLESFICGEMLEGDNAYMCRACAPPRKVRTLKRVCVKTLPSVLVLNLKRFEFDYDEMRKCKLNDLVTFPTEPGGLDMEPFTKEGIRRREEAAATAKDTTQTTENASTEGSAEESLPLAAPSLQVGSSQVTAGPPTTYTLVGVLLHSGGSESGHYTSLVKDRRSSGPSRWLEFNDSVVREFDATQLASECFGGSHTVLSWDAKLRRKVTKEVEKTRSAYLLIYERDTQPSQTDTPMTSPSKSRSDTTLKVSTNFTSAPDSPKPVDASVSSTTAFSTPTRHATSRAKTPSSYSHRTPSDSPPPARIARSTSASGLRLSQRLEFGHELESDALPPLSPSFSRAPSEQKVPELPPSRSGDQPPPAVGTMPPQIYEAIWEENMAFMKNRQLFQPDYFGFLTAFLQLAPPPEPDNTDTGDSRPDRLAYGLPSVVGCEDEVRHIQLAAIFLTDVLAHAKYITNPAAFERDRDRLEDQQAAEQGGLAARHVGGHTGIAQRRRMHIDGSTAPHALLPLYKAILMRFFSTHLPAACWFVRDHLLGHRSRLRYFLFDCSSEFMRDCLSEVFAAVMPPLAAAERARYEQMDTCEIPVPSGTTVSAPNSPAGTTIGVSMQTIRTPSAFLLQLIDHLMMMFRDLAFNAKSLSPYFALLHAFASLGYNERLYLLQTHHIIVATIDLLLGNQSPFAAHEKYRRPVMGDAETPPNLFNAYRLLSLAVRSTLMDTNPEDQLRGLPPTLLTIKDGTLPLASADDEDGMQLSSATPIQDDPTESLPRLSRATSSASSRSRTAPSTPTHGMSRFSPFASSSLVLQLPPAEEMTPTFLRQLTRALTSQEMEILFNEAFLKKMMKEGANIEANRDILTHIVFDEDRADAYVCGILLKAVEDANYDRLDPLFALLPSLLSIDDTLQARRIERYLNPRTGLIAKAGIFRAQYPLFTYYTLKFLLLALGKMEGHPVQNFLKLHRDSLYWGLAWIQHHHERTLTKPNSLHFKPAPGGQLAPPAPMTRADMQRQVSTFDTVTAISDWFGAEYLAERAELDRREQEAAEAAQQARLRARDAAVTTRASRHSTSANSHRHQAGPVFSNDSDDSHESAPDSDDDADPPDDDDPAAFAEEERRLDQLLSMPDGVSRVLRAAHKFRYQHPRLEQLKLHLHGAGVGSDSTSNSVPLMQALTNSRARTLFLGDDTDDDEDDDDPRSGAPIVADSDDSVNGADVDLDLDSDLDHGIAPDPQQVHDVDLDYFDDDPIEQVRQFELRAAEEAARRAERGEHD